MNGETFPRDGAGVTMGHWHLNSRDLAATRRILVTMGGTPHKTGDFEVVRFPGVIVFLNVAPGAEPPAGGTVGSVIDHVCLSVQDIQESAARWKAAGIPVQPGKNNRPDQAFVETPDGLRMEILHDKDQQFPVQHHHLHYFVPEAAIPGIRAWYAEWFGAVPGVRSEFQAADLPGANLSFSAASTPVVTTRGRVLDHIGFDVKNLAALCKRMEAAGVNIATPYTRNPRTGAALAFIYDPWGTYIELNERPTPL
jgi:catechol 2,3-dioxygenase-like lactoylglutathione lyase family enzyme